MMKKIKMFMTVFAAIAITACSNDNEFPGQPPADLTENASDAYAAFSISIPSAPAGTRAATSATIHTGTPAENAVRSLHVFIYDATPPYSPTVAEFTTAEGTLSQEKSGSTRWIANKPVKTRKTDKYIFVGVNLNTDIVDYITSNGFGAFTYKEFAQEVRKLADTTKGFVMFNNNYPALTLASSLYDNESDALNNHLSIPVNRVVAKAAVFKTASFIVNGGGDMTDLKFGWRNLNKKFYFIQDRRESLIKDPNWQSYTEQDFTRGSDALDIYNATDIPANFSYTTENAFQYMPGTSNVDGASFISISGTFAPNRVISTQNATPAMAADFTSVNNPNPSGSTFFVVRTDDGIANYFADGAVAEKYAALCKAGTTGLPSLNGNYTLSDNTYTDGQCYFHLFVNQNAVSPQAPYNVYRNQYFKININSIQAPGNPSDNFDQGEAIQPSSWISADITVTPWEEIEENYDL